jgi:hypothetical protein
LRSPSKRPRRTHGFHDPLASQEYRAVLRIEPRTSRTRSENHATRPNSQLIPFLERPQFGATDQRRDFCFRRAAPFPLSTKLTRCVLWQRRLRVSSALRGKGHCVSAQAPYTSCRPHARGAHHCRRDRRQTRQIRRRLEDNGQALRFTASSRKTGNQAEVERMTSPFPPSNVLRETQSLALGGCCLSTLDSGARGAA